jgi:RNA polymerase sigma factor (TIGR02999 family)
MQATEGLSSLLARARKGDPQAVNDLFECTYAELRRLARARLSVRPRDTLLDTTSLVHECYLRLAKIGHLQVEDRAHFLGYAARAMRTVIVDLVRRRRTKMRGSMQPHLPLNDTIEHDAAADANQILQVHDCLSRLENLDPRMAQVVEMRYFAGMTEPEIAAALSVGERTVRRDWQRARIWLRTALR